jgi:hypothetical protein
VIPGVCDCCEEPTFLMDIDGVWVVETERDGARSAEEIRTAPRRPARWCLACRRRHERWRRTHGVRGAA